MSTVLASRHMSHLQQQVPCCVARQFFQVCGSGGGGVLLTHFVTGCHYNHSKGAVRYVRLVVRVWVVSIVEHQEPGVA